MKIYKQRRTRPYFANGKTAFNIQNRPGVYLIYRGETIVYIGFSGSNLYKAMYRHFQQWRDSQQVRITYDRNDPKITVRVVYTMNGHQAAKLERALIVKYSPKDNPQKYIEHQLTNADEQKLDQYRDTECSTIARYEGDIPF